MLTTTIVFVVLATVASMLIVPYFIAKLQQDFLNQRPSRSNNLVIVIVRNIIGYCVLAIGIILLFLPGQGILTIVAGILLIDYPYKYKVERYILSRPKIFKVVNWSRKKMNSPPLDQIYPVT